MSITKNVSGCGKWGSWQKHLEIQCGEAGWLCPSCAKKLHDLLSEWSQFGDEIDAGEGSWLEDLKTRTEVIL